MNNGNINEMRQVRQQELINLSPWLTGSRRKLLMIWGPFQVLTLAFTVWLASDLFAVPAEDVKRINNNLYVSGVLLQGYFLFMVFRDLATMVYQFFLGDHLGFWKALTFHLLWTPLDSLIILVLTSYAAIVLNAGAGAKCSENELCRPFLAPLRTDIVLGFLTVFLNAAAKVCLFILFLFALGGLQMLVDDIEEHERVHNEKASISAM